MGYRDSAGVKGGGGNTTHTRWGVSAPAMVGGGGGGLTCGAGGLQAAPLLEGVLGREGRGHGGSWGGGAGVWRWWG